MKIKGSLRCGTFPGFEGWIDIWDCGIIDSLCKEQGFGFTGAITIWQTKEENLGCKGAMSIWLSFWIERGCLTVWEPVASIVVPENLAVDLFAGLQLALQAFLLQWRELIPLRQQLK